MNRKHYHLIIGDMQCIDCENNIEEAVLSLPGIIEAKASFTEECLELILDAEVISIKTVYAAIKNAGYSCHLRPVKTTAKTAGRVGLIVMSVGDLGFQNKTDSLSARDGYVIFTN